MRAKLCAQLMELQLMKLLPQMTRGPSVSATRVAWPRTRKRCHEAAAWQSSNMFKAKLTLLHRQELQLENRNGQCTRAKCCLSSPLATEQFVSGTGLPTTRSCYGRVIKRNPK